METSTKISEDKAAWRRRRRSFRKLMAFATLGCAVFLAPFYWLGTQTERQLSQEAAEYQQECSYPAARSPNCQVLTLRVYEHREEGALDPDSDTDYLLGLQSRSGQRFEVDTLSSQWQRIGVGDSVTATVWNGEVEEIADSGGSEYTKNNPVKKQEGRASRADINAFLAALLGFAFLYFVADMLHEQYWARKARNDTEQ